jgi:hypothetical protein
VLIAYKRKVSPISLLDNRGYSDILDWCLHRTRMRQ